MKSRMFVLAMSSLVALNAMSALADDDGKALLEATTATAGLVSAGGGAILATTGSNARTELTQKEQQIKEFERNKAQTEINRVEVLESGKMAPIVTENQVAHAKSIVTYRNHLQAEKLQIARALEQDEREEVREAIKAYLTGDEGALQKMAIKYDHVRSDLAKLQVIDKDAKMPSMEQYLEAVKTIEISKISTQNPHNAVFHEFTRQILGLEGAVQRAHAEIKALKGRSGYRVGKRAPLVAMGIGVPILVGEFATDLNLANEAVSLAQRKDLLSPRASSNETSGAASTSSGGKLN